MLLIFTNEGEYRIDEGIFRKASKFTLDSDLLWKALPYTRRRMDWVPVKLLKQAVLMGSCGQRYIYVLYMVSCCKFLLRYRY